MKFFFKVLEFVFHVKFFSVFDSFRFWIVSIQIKLLRVSCEMRLLNVGNNVIDLLFCSLNKVLKLFVFVNMSLILCCSLPLVKEDQLMFDDG